MKKDKGKESHVKNRDLDFISSRFTEITIPKDKKFLKKYFKTPLQTAILKYYFVFGETVCFIEHTGFYTTKSYLYRQEQRLREILKAHEKAKLDFDIEQIWKIESGKYTCNSKNSEDNYEQSSNDLV